ncbi:MAG: response regulator [Hyphomicrobium sp.]|nr:response regulator [Hyphomicrobium sp.]
MLNGLKILVLEDNLVIAMDVELLLQDCGADVVETVSTASAALAKLADFSPDVAVLDINLDSGTSLPVAEALLERGIPFIFATGYSDPSMLPEAFAHIDILPKPFEASALERALSEAFQRRKAQS